MDTVAIYIFVSVSIISLISLVGVAVLALSKSTLDRILFILVSVAAGALFGDAFVHLIPESFATIGNSAYAAGAVLAGILTFFVLEKFLHWHHTHHIVDGDECEHGIGQAGRIRPLGFLVLSSDSAHNFVDGVIIAAAYMVSIEVGIATTIAVALHEIPQEIGDFALLVHSGFSRLGALAFNFLSALFAVLGAAVVVIAGATMEGSIPFVLAFAAGGFIYIAGSDLLPEMHKVKSVGRSSVQFLALVFGIMAMFSVEFIVERYFPEGHLHEHSEEVHHHEHADEHHHDEHLH